MYETADISFFCAGEALHGRFTAPEKPIGLVVMATGGGTKGSQGDTWSRMPVLFARSSFTSFVFDFAGQGRSSGERRELTISKGVSNLKSAIDFSSSDARFAGLPVYLLGSSFGGNVVLEYLSREEPKIVGALLKSPCIDLKESYFQDLGHVGMAAWKKEGFSSETGLNWDVMDDSDNLNLTKRLSSITTPIFVTHGTEDESVPLHQSRTLLRSVSGPAYLLELGGCNHHYSGAHDWSLMASQMLAWLETIAGGIKWKIE